MKKKRANTMTTARIQPCSRKLDFNFGYYNGEEIWRRIIIERNKALFSYNNHFCLKWKSEGVSFFKANKQLKDNVEIVRNYITEGNVNSYFKYEFITKKIESHPPNFIVYDLETLDTDRTRPYFISFYR